MTLRVRWQIVDDRSRATIAAGTQEARVEGAYETAMRAAEAIERALLALSPGAAVPPRDAPGIARAEAVQ